MAVSLRDLVQYAWLAAVPEAYAAGVVGEVVRNLQAAKTELAQRLMLAGGGAQAVLVARYGNHDSANGMESVAGNVVGTLASMIQLHINLKERGNVDDLLQLGAPGLWQSIAPGNGIPHLIAAEWRKIEAVDYMPLSTIAAGMLEDSELGPKLGGTLRAEKPDKMPNLPKIELDSAGETRYIFIEQIFAGISGELRRRGDGLAPAEPDSAGGLY